MAEYDLIKENARLQSENNALKKQYSSIRNWFFITGLLLFMFGFYIYAINQDMGIFSILISIIMMLR